MDSTLLACAPFALAGLALAVAVVVSPRLREAYTRTDTLDEAPSPAMHARRMVAAVATGGAVRVGCRGVSVERVGRAFRVTCGGMVRTYPSPAAAEEAVARRLCAVWAVGGGR